MTVHRVLHIPSVTYRRYRETITHSSVYSLLFLLSLSLNRTKWNAIAAISKIVALGMKFPMCFRIFLKRDETRDKKIDFNPFGNFG